MQLANQSYPADLLGVVTPVSSRRDREFTKSKDGEKRPPCSAERRSDVGRAPAALQYS